MSIKQRPDLVMPNETFFGIYTLFYYVEFWPKILKFYKELKTEV